VSCNDKCTSLLIQDIIRRLQLIETNENILKVSYNRWHHLAARKSAQICPYIFHQNLPKYLATKSSKLLPNISADFFAIWQKWLPNIRVDLGRFSCCQMTPTLIGVLVYLLLFSSNCSLLVIPRICKLVHLSLQVTPTLV
jgi:hypothetical protein